MSLDQLLEWIPNGGPEEALARQVEFDRLPRHVAIIMDGNGRWAGERRLPRVEGHRAGVDSVRDVVETSARLGLEVLTLYAFSVENWKRPAAEVSTLMMLLKRYLGLELETLLRNNIRFNVIGRSEALAPDVPHGAARRRAQDGARTPACCSTSRLNYGGRTEIVDAARRAMESGIKPEDLDEDRFCELAVHRRPARSRPADPDERRNARQQFPAVADRLRGDLGHRHAVARLPLPPPARRRGRVPEARSPLRRHHAAGPRGVR